MTCNRGRRLITHEQIKKSGPTLTYGEITWHDGGHLLIVALSELSIRRVSFTLTTQLPRHEFSQFEHTFFLLQTNAWNAQQTKQGHKKTFGRNNLRFWGEERKTIKYAYGSRMFIINVTSRRLTRLNHWLTLEKYSFESFVVGTIVSAPGCQFAGHTSPYWSTKRNANQCG